MRTLKRRRRRAGVDSNCASVGPVLDEHCGVTSASVAGPSFPQLESPSQVPRNSRPDQVQGEGPKLCQLEQGSPRDQVVVSVVLFLWDLTRAALPSQFSKTRSNSKGRAVIHSDELPPESQMPVYLTTVELPRGRESGGGAIVPSRTKPQGLSLPPRLELPRRPLL